MSEATPPASIEKRSTGEAAFELYIAGLDYPEIARQLGVSKQAAHQAARRYAAKRRREDGAEFVFQRATAGARLHRLIRIAYSLAEEEPSAAAVRAIVAVEERAARFFGYDRQPENTVSVEVGLVSYLQAREAAVGPLSAAEAVTLRKELEQ